MPATRAASCGDIVFYEADGDSRLEVRPLQRLRERGLGDIGSHA